MKGEKQEAEAALCRNGPGDTVSVDPRAVRLSAEMRGTNNLAERVCAEAALSATLHLRRVLQDARKFTRRGKRLRTTIADLHRSIKRNDASYIPFVPDSDSQLRQASVGGKTFYYEEDRDIDVNSLLTKDLEKVPVEVALRSHWLVIDGRQPAVPENPAPESLEEQTEKALNPTTLAGGAAASGSEGPSTLERPKSVWEVLQGRTSLSAPGSTTGLRQAAGPDLALFKEVKNHELSVEQQLFYREITEACVGSSEEKRLQALNSLSTDSGLHQILPRLITFIVEGIRVNTVQSNLALLIYLVRMLKALLENPNLYLDKYLHEMLPACMTCIICRQLCLRPESDNHWALRDFAAKQLSIMCQKYTNPNYHIGARVCLMLSKPLKNPSRAPLGSVYGALSAMSELGPEVVRTCLIPSLPAVCSRITDLLAAIEEADRGPPNLTDRLAQVSSLDRRAVDQIQSLLLSRLPPVLKNHPLAPNEDQKDYTGVFGPALGPKMFAAVNAARQQPSKGGQQASGVTCLKPRRRARVPAQGAGQGPNTPATAPAASSNLRQMRQDAKQMRLKSEPGGASPARRLLMVKEENG